MPQYQQIPVAGNLAGANAIRAVFDVANQSDIPQLQAWDNENMNTSAIECLIGTAVNGSKSMVCAKSTNDGNSAAGLGWATGLVQTAGGAVANRLKGNSSFVLLGTTAPTGPFPVSRTFQYAMACCSDSSPGSIGYQPKLAVKMFYTGAAPTVNFDYNSGSDGAPNWVRMTSSAMGSAMPIGVGNTIFATGPGTVAGTSNDGVLDNVTKPGNGESFAPQYWVRTL